MTKEEIMLDTFQYYEEDPTRRAKAALPDIGESCVYLSPEGNMCAVGRYLNWGYIRDAGLSIERINEVGDIYELVEFYAFSLFKKEVGNYPIEFWSDLQSYHDSDDYWVGDNAEMLREKYKQKLLVTYNDNPLQEDRIISYEE